MASTPDRVLPIWGRHRSNFAKFSSYAKLCGDNRAWHKGEMGIDAPTLAMDNHSQPRSGDDGVRWATRPACADDPLIAKSKAKVREVYSALQAAATALGIAAEDDKLDLWSTYPGQAIAIVGRRPWQPA